jgi:hypothetical protein
MPPKLITPITPPSLTAVQVQAAAFTTRMNNLYNGLDLLFSQLAGFIYGNPNPQEVFDAFGTGAGDLFTAATAYAALVLAYEGITVPSPVPTGATIVVNSDGTVTYTAPPSPTTGN